MDNVFTGLQQTRFNPTRMNSILKQPKVSRKQSAKLAAGSAFTLIELLVVICVVTLLAATLVPTLAGSRIGSQSLRCMNNNRQLCAAWRMYADDSNERLVYASTADSSSLISTDPSDPDNYAWTGAHMDFNGANRANWDPAYDMMKRPLWSYAKTQTIYKCPSDRSTVQTAGGVKPRILTMSMNLYVGGFAPQIGVDPPPNGTGGHWAFAD